MTLSRQSGSREVVPLRSPEDSGVTIERVRHRKDRRFVVVLIKDGDQHLREFPRDMEREARWFAEGYRMAKSVWGG